MIFIKLVVLLFPLVIIDAGEGFRTDCKFHNYSGGPGEVIAKFEPTLPGKVSLEFGSKAYKILTKLIGGLPEVGKPLSIFFGVIGAAIDPTMDDLAALQKAVNDLIADIKKTVMDLKKYVDAKFDEYDYDQKSKALKGLYRQSTVCSSFGNPDNIEDCLHVLAFAMVREYPTFLPTHPKYETFEQLMPMTRQFADLHIAALLHLLKIKNLDPDYKSMLANFTIVVCNYFIHGINVTVHQHLKNWKYPTYNMVDEVDKLDNSPYCYLYGDCHICVSIGAYTCTQQWDNGDGCQLQYPVPAKPVPCVIGAVYFHECFKLIYRNLDSYHSVLTLNIRSYWYIEVVQTLTKWKEIGIKLGAKESSYLWPYLPDPIEQPTVFHNHAIGTMLGEYVRHMQNVAHATLSKHLKKVDQKKDEL